MPQPQQSPAATSMQQYLSTYGQRLQSLLDGTMTPESARLANPVPMAPDPQRGSPMNGGSALEPQQAPQSALESGPNQPNPAQTGPQQQQSGGADSFRARWEQTPQKERVQFADRLEGDLAKGNQTIDSAYDDLVKQMGTRPDADNKLTREEKGMLLMEFGLNLMARSSSDNLPDAIGKSGLSALEGHRGRRRAKRDEYDQNRLDIEKNRAQSKVRYAEQSALEEARDTRELARDRRREEREDSQITNVIAQPDNSVVGVTRSGRASKLEVDGEPVRQRPPVGAGGGGRGGRGFESDRRYQLYMDTYGVGADGKPLTGEGLQKVKERALAFSADPKSATLSDAEARTISEKAAVDFQRSNWSLFRDFTPDQALNWRNDMAEKNYKRLKEGRDIELQPPEGAEPASALEGPSTSKRNIPTRPAPRSGTVAPAGALSALKANPDKAADFLKKFGYLPAEYHRYLK
jgi:hypothetical protein